MSKLSKENHLWLAENARYIGEDLIIDHVDAFEKLLELESKLTQAQETIEQLSNQWISVEDRLPETRDELLFYVKELDQIELGKFNHSAAKWIMPHRDTYYQTGFGWVTHWMPLPSPPNE